MNKSLLITEVFPPKNGGSGRWFWEIYRRLPRNEFLIAAGEDPRQEEFDASHDLGIIRMPLSFSTWGIASIAGLRQYLRIGKLLNRLIKQEGIQAIHCGKCLPEALLAWLMRKWRGIPYICYVHGEELNLAASSRELRWLTHRALLGASFVIANSQNTEGILLQNWGLPKDRIRILYPGVDTHRFVPAKLNNAERQRLGWVNRAVILTVGRLQKRKGHDNLILALNKIKEFIPTVLYSIIGDGEERLSLRQLVDKQGAHDYVQFLGELQDDDLINCYQQADLFVLPNRQVGQDIEGFGMVLLEAQACGKPVLAGASGGTAETMRIPETGFVVPCEDYNELAKAILDLLRHPDRLADMGYSARDWVVERFDWSPLALNAKRIFNDIQSERAPLRKPVNAQPFTTSAHQASVASAKPQ
jgi:phosphatidylinositol alpha-1,6-mannosyltransferase